MVDTYGRWVEESDYNTYPKEKWCDYDVMAAWIREQGYKPKTSMENLITMIFIYFDEEFENNISDYGAALENFDGSYTKACQSYVEDGGGLAEFDYWT